MILMIFCLMKIFPLLTIQLAESAYAHEKTK